MRWSLRGVVCIGNPRGRVALFLDREDAHNLAAQFRPPDLAYAELMDAAAKAYPETEDDE